MEGPSVQLAQRAVVSAGETEAELEGVVTVVHTLCVFAARIAAFL